MKKWLIRNKIFFEIFSYVFLGVASIVVGLMTWKTGQRELELSEIDREPVITVQVDRNTDRKPITVFNDGYHLFEPMVFATSVFQVEQHIPDNQNKFFLFRVEDYYTETPETGKTRGAIANKPIHPTGVGQIERIKKEIQEISQREGITLEFRQIIFVFISYEDINKKFVERLFVVDDYIWETSSSHFNLILEKVEEKINNSELASFSGDLIYQRLTEKETLPYPFTTTVLPF